MVEPHGQLLRRPSIIDQHLANLLHSVSIDVEVNLTFLKTLLRRLCHISLYIIIYIMTQCIIIHVYLTVCFKTILLINEKSGYMTYFVQYFFNKTARLSLKVSTTGIIH